MGDRMSDVSGGPQSKLRESISALIDGEADELELRRILANADTQEVRESWRSYHLQRDMLNGGDMRFAHIDISLNIQSVLAEESLPAVAGSRWWRPFASVAVAASVAAVVVVGARGLNSNGNDAAVAQSNISAAGVFPVGSFSSPVSNVAVGAAMMSSPAFAQPAALDPDQFARQRLQQYLLRHTERAALNNGQGVISFSKVSELGDEQ
ncbi:MAG: sigma-E factor negative regulatory protein [Spongiibacteraceae bacterium]